MPKLITAIVLLAFIDGTQATAQPTQYPADVSAPMNSDQQQPVLEAHVGPCQWRGDQYLWKAI
jgi:hypothetical protein